MQKYLLKNRYTLLASVIVGFILIVVIEGILMERQSRVYTFDNPYFEFRQR